MFKGLLPMPPDEGPPLPRGLELRWPGVGVTELKLRELIDRVPDIDDPGVLSYWVEVGDKLVYLEGWCDMCLISTGFPSMERGNHQEKIAYIEDITKQTLERKTKPKENPYGKELRLIRGGFEELPDAENLYGVSYGIYEKQEA